MLKPVEYSTRPVTLRQVGWMTQVGKGDFTALAPLLSARTNLTEDEILDLDLDDATTIALKTVETMKQAIALTKLGEQFDGQQR